MKRAILAIMLGLAGCQVASPNQIVRYAPDLLIVPPFEGCWTGPNDGQMNWWIVFPNGNKNLCAAFDFDLDADVDLRDYAAWLRG